MKQTIQVDITQIPNLIERLNLIALQNMENELGSVIWNYLQFIDGAEHDSDLYFGIQAFCQRNGINLETRSVNNLLTLVKNLVNRNISHTFV